MLNAILQFGKAFGFGGGNGNDFLDGAVGADRLFGLAGNDRLIAGRDSAVDTVRGGAGDDSGEVDADTDDALDVETLTFL